MRSARSRRKDQFSPLTSKQYSSQHELPVRVVPRGGRRTVSVSKKKSTKSSPSHMRKRERERDARAQREKRKEKKRNVRAPVCTPAWPMWMEITSLIFVVVVGVLGGGSF